MYISSIFEDIDFYFCTPLGAVWNGAISHLQTEMGFAEDFRYSLYN